MGQNYYAVERDDGRRHRGKHKKRWCDDVDTFMKNWPEKVTQREEWKAMGETFDSRKTVQVE